MTTLRPEDYRRRQEQVAGWPVNVASYKLGDCFLCEVDNVSPGARIARAEGASREEAERRALDDAARRLGRTRTFTTE